MANEEALKNSFQKIKEDITHLSSEISNIKNQMKEIVDVLYSIKVIQDTQIPKLTQESTSSTSSDRQTTHIQQMAENPAQNTYYNDELSLNSHSSIGNRGVPADRQQTVSRQIVEEKTLPEPTPSNNNPLEESKERMDNNSNISLLLDNLKKDLKEKFLSLTKQEFLIFSLIYSLTEEHGEATYKEIALRSKLTESSIRDYISRLEHKGIPLIKEKKNNKLVVIKVPKELRDIAALDSLAKLNKI